MDTPSDDSDFEAVQIIKKQARRSSKTPVKTTVYIDTNERKYNEAAGHNTSGNELSSDDDIFNSTKRCSKSVIQSDSEEEQDGFLPAYPSVVDWNCLENELTSDNEVKIVEIKESGGIRKTLALGKPLKKTTPVKRKGQMSILAFSQQSVSSATTNKNDLIGGKGSSSVKNLTGSIKQSSLKSLTPQAPCPLCNKYFPLDKIEAHADICADTLFTSPVNLSPGSSHSPHHEDLSFSPQQRPLSPRAPSPLFTTELSSDCDYRTKVSPREQSVFPPDSPREEDSDSITFSPQKTPDTHISAKSSQEVQWTEYKAAHQDRWNSAKCSQDSAKSSQDKCWNSAAVISSSLESLPSYRNDIFDDPGTSITTSTVPTTANSTWNLDNSFTHSSDSSNKRRRISHTPKTNKTTPGTYPSINTMARGALRNPDNDPGIKVQSLLALHCPNDSIITNPGGKRKKIKVASSAASSSSNLANNNSFTNSSDSFSNNSSSGLGFKLHPFLSKAQPSGGDLSAVLIPDADGGFTIDTKVLDECTEEQPQFSLPSLSGGFIDFNNQFKEKSTPRPRKSTTTSPKKKKGKFRGGFRGRGFRRKRGGGRGRGRGASEPNYTF